MDQTAHIRNALPELFRELGIKVLLDVPCGDFHWMSHVDIYSLRYFGGDIVTEMVRGNRVDYGSNDIEFHVINIITDHLPKADVILCRDCLVHLNLEDGLKDIQNLKRSGAKYLLSTTFSDYADNTDKFRHWRPLNLQSTPFNLRRPLKIINEKCTEIHLGSSYSDKSLGLWELRDI